MATVADVSTTTGTTTDHSGTAPGSTDGTPAGPDSPNTPLTPTPPADRRPGVNWKKWRARLVVVLMIAGAVAAVSRLTEFRAHDNAQFDLGTVTLVGQPLGVEPDQVGRVTKVTVEPQQQVRSGQNLGTIEVTTTTATGRQKIKKVQMTAPTAGIISSDPVPVGSVVQPGVPFLKMYDPAELTLVTSVKVAALPQLSAGMVATLAAPGLTHPVTAVVERVVPRVGAQTDVTGKALPGDKIQVVLTPRRAADVARMVPGLRFTGSVDTATGPAGAGNSLQTSS